MRSEPRRSWGALALVAALAQAGCNFDWDSLRPDGSVPRDVGARDVARDMVVADRGESPVDVPVDRVEMDVVDVVAVDARAEAGADVMDARADVGVDAGMDVPVDRGPDVADVVVDRGPMITDTGTDTGPSCVGVMCPCVAGNPTGWCHPGESCTATGCVAGTVAGSLLITELMYDPMRVGDTTGEWFEIHNPSATTAINLERVRVTSENDPLSVTLPAGLRIIVPPRGHVVFARSAVPSENGNLPNVAYAYGGSLVLGNSADFLQLDLQPAATLIHRVAYNNAMGWPRGMGRSVSLRPTAHDLTQSAVASSWCDGPTQWMPPTSDFGSPGMMNPPCP